MRDLFTFFVLSCRAVNPFCPAFGRSVNPLSTVCGKAVYPFFGQTSSVREWCYSGQIPQDKSGQDHHFGGGGGNKKKSSKNSK